MTKTRHNSLSSGQQIFRALAYSSDDVLELGDAIDIKPFLANPVLLVEHNSGNPAGQFIQLEWTKAGLETEFYFDTGSEEGREAERKWMKGLRSSLSIGASGRRNKDGDGYTWRLAEISQVAVPLDPKATASPKQRKPARIASVAALNDVKIGENEEVMVYLTASAATSNELNPVRVHSEPEPEPAPKKKASKPPKPSSHMEEQIKVLTDLVAELKANNERLSEEIKSLKASLEEKDKDITSAQEAQAKAEASLKEHLDKDPITRSSLKELADDVAKREAELKEKAEALEERRARIEVTAEMTRWNEFLPSGFSGEGCTVRDVLLAAAPRNMITEDKTDDWIRGALEMESDRRFRASIPRRNAERPPVTVTDGGYISPDRLKQLVAEN